MEFYLKNGKLRFIDDHNSDLLKDEYRELNGYAIRVNIKDAYKENVSPHLHVRILERKIGRRLYENEMVDHINRLRWDDREDNLRVASRKENNRNRGKIVKQTSCEFKGVYKKRNNWVARIEKEGNSIVLGHFKSAEIAARHYDSAATELFGEYACTNVKLGLLPSTDEFFDWKDSPHKNRKKSNTHEKNICYHIKRGNYQVSIQINGFRHYFNSIPTLEKAIIIRDKFLNKIKNLKLKKNVKKIQVQPI